MEKNEKKSAENGMNGKYISNVELLPVPVKRGKNINLIIFICTCIIYIYIQHPVYVLITSYIPYVVYLFRDICNLSNWILDSSLLFGQTKQQQRMH